LFVAVPAGAEAAAEVIKPSSFFAIPSQVLLSLLLRLLPPLLHKFYF
jgi:hypothetical protein